MALIRNLVAAQLAILSTGCLAQEQPPNPERWTISSSAFFLGVNGGIAWAQERLNRYSTVLATLRPRSPFGTLHASYQRGIDAFLGSVEEAKTALEIDSGAGFYVDAVRSPARGYNLADSSALFGRLGYDFGGLAVYATGGGGWTTVSKSTVAASAFPRIGERTAPGNALGAGFAYKIGGNWAAFSEYRYSEFTSSSLVDAGLSPGAKPTRRLTDSSFFAGASYHFR